MIGKLPLYCIDSDKNFMQSVEAGEVKIFENIFYILLAPESFWMLNKCCRRGEDLGCCVIVKVKVAVWWQSMRLQGFRPDYVTHELAPQMKNIEFAFARHASASSEMEQKIYDLLITFVRHSSAIAKPESSLNYLTAWSQLLANSAKSQPTHLVAPLWFMDVLKTFANANSSRHFFAFLSLVLGETRLTFTCAICAERKIFRIFPFSGLQEKQSCLSRWICFWNWFGLRNRFACGGRQM